MNQPGPRYPPSLLDPQHERVEHDSNTPQQPSAQGINRSIQAAVGEALLFVRDGWNWIVLFAFLGVLIGATPAVQWLTTTAYGALWLPIYWVARFVLPVMFLGFLHAFFAMGLRGQTELIGSVWLGRGLFLDGLIVTIPALLVTGLALSIGDTTVGTLSIALVCVACWPAAMTCIALSTNPMYQLNPIRWFSLIWSGGTDYAAVALTSGLPLLLIPLFPSSGTIHRHLYAVIFGVTLLGVLSGIQGRLIAWLLERRPTILPT